MLDVMLGFKGVIAEFESRDRPGEFVPWLTELPFTFPWTKNDSFAEFVELAARERSCQTQTARRREAELGGVREAG